MRLLPLKKTALAASVFFLVVFFCLAEAAVANASGTVEKIRHWSSPTYTRIVIDVNKKSKYNPHLLKKDPSINVKHRRLYVDIFGTRLGKGLSKHIPINDGLLKAARAGQFKEDTVRVVLDIESIDDYKVFALTNPYRIVIDVTGKGFAKKTPPTPAPKATPSLPLLTGPHEVKTIVIDAGHGGKDPGAVGKGKLREKDVTLKVAKLLKKRLEKATGAKVILTRDKDVFIPLEERTAIANAKGADLFISVHANASRNRKAKGVETYFLDVSNDKRSMELAARENKATEEDMGALQIILSDLIRTANRNDSSNLAETVQKALVSSLKRSYRNVKGNGVKGAPFYVLVRTNMPSILVEISFISNPTEEKRLRSSKYLGKIADGITAGVAGFINGSSPGKHAGL